MKKFILPLIIVAAICFFFVSVKANQKKAFLITTYNKVWEPRGTALLNFGKILITKDTISWDSGQSSKYVVKSGNETECLVELTSDSLPMLHTSFYKFLRFKDSFDADFQEVQLDVSFYKSYDRALDDDVSMWGLYTLRE